VKDKNTVELFYENLLVTLLSTNNSGLKIFYKSISLKMHISKGTFFITPTRMAINKQSA
jgi:hypothetical protein